MKIVWEIDGDTKMSKRLLIKIKKIDYKNLKKYLSSRIADLYHRKIYHSKF